MSFTDRSPGGKPVATLLLTVIYIAFIGLGLPDSLFGTAWPVMYREFDLPVSYAGIVSMLTCCGTIVSSLVSSRVINRFGTGAVTAASTALTAVAIIGYRFAPSLGWICLFAIPLGLGAGAIDAALNNYVALHYSAAQMSYLHCFYGVGVSLSPYLMSLVITGANSWRGGYRLAFFIQLAITVVCIAALPLWKKAHSQPGSAIGDEPRPRSISLRTLAKYPEVRAVWMIFLCSVGVEFTAGNWAGTFLVDHKGLPADSAAEIVSLYYLGMTLGRFISGVLSSRLSGWRMILLGQGIILAAIVLLALPFGLTLSAAGLFLIGLGNGPVYPNLTHLTPINFGREVSQSVVGSQMAFANTGAMLVSPLFGLVARSLGVKLLPWYTLLFFAPMLLSTIFAAKRLSDRALKIE